MESKADKNLFDPQILTDLYSDTPDLQLELAGLFQEDLPPHVSKLGTAIEEDDAEKVKFHAHTVKGMAANMGMEKLRALCLDLESMGLNNELTRAREVYENVSQVMEGILPLVRKWEKELQERIDGSEPEVSSGDSDIGEAWSAVPPSQ